jgi:hypothetical protein
MSGPNYLFTSIVPVIEQHYFFCEIRTGILSVVYIHLLFALKTYISGRVWDLNGFSEPIKEMENGPENSTCVYVRGKQRRVGAENCIMKSFIICKPHQKFGQSNKEE